MRNGVLRRSSGGSAPGAAPVTHGVREYLVVGVSHRTAHVGLRERFAVDAARLPAVLDAIRACEGIDEAVLLSTCNRVEWYLAAERPDAAAAAATAFFGAAGSDAESAVRVAVGVDAVRHAFRVAGGLESMIVGECQILGQMRAGFGASQAAGSVGPSLDALFRAALAAGRRVQRETELGRGAASVPAAAVAHARRLLGSLADRRVLVIGAGKMGEVTVRAMVDAGARAVVVVNRTAEAARDLAAMFGGAVAPFGQLADELARADVAIVSTGAGSILLDASTVAAAAAGRTTPLVIVDIAVPRNVEPAAGAIPGVHLCDIDDLMDTPDGAGRDSLRRAEALVEDDVQGFLRARAARGAASAIAAARADANAILEQEWGRARGRLASLTPEEAETVRMVLQRIVNKVLHRPITALTAAAETGHLAGGPAADAGEGG